MREKLLMKLLELFTMMPEEAEGAPPADMQSENISEKNPAAELPFPKEDEELV